MRVNNITSPNFGMAAYFTKEGAKLTTAQASRVLNSNIQRLGDALAHTKVYNAEITVFNNNVVPRIITPDTLRLLPPYKVCRPNGSNTLRIYARYDGPNLGGDCIPGFLNYPIELKYRDYAEAANAFSRANRSDFDAAAEIVTKFEESYNSKKAQDEAFQKEREEAAKQAQILVNSLGIK